MLGRGQSGTEAVVCLALAAMTMINDTDGVNLAAGALIALSLPPEVPR